MGGPAGRRAARALQHASQPLRAGFIGSPAMNFADVTLATTMARYGPRRRDSASACRSRSPIASTAVTAARPRSASVPRHPYCRAGRPGRLVLRRRGRGGRTAWFGDPARHAGRQLHFRRVSRPDTAHAGSRSPEARDQSCPAPFVRRPDRGGDLRPHCPHQGNAVNLGPNPGFEHVPLGLALLGERLLEVVAVGRGIERAVGRVWRSSATACPSRP